MRDTSKIADTGVISGDVKERGTHAFHLWMITTAVSMLYFLVFYMLPLIRIIPVYPFLYKGVLEVILFIVTLGASILLIVYGIQTPPIQMRTNDAFLIMRSDGNIVAICCLQISSVSPTIENTSVGNSKYNTTMLLAIRNGMAKNVTMAYEVGVSHNEPFIRMFITAKGHSEEQVNKILSREAMRIEAVLVASLANVELEQLKGQALENAVFEHMPTSINGTQTTDTTVMMGGRSSRDYEPHTTDDSEIQVFSLKGEPSVVATAHSSQIGTFISTLLKQGYEAAFTCVFAPGRPGRERRRLEQEWRSIREKEKKKMDSLADQSNKTELIQEYQKLRGVDTWFETSTFVRVRRSKARQMPPKEAVIGLINSIWGGDGFGPITELRTDERLKLRILLRRHLKQERLHVNKLAAYINTPVQQIPFISATNMPNFSIPHKDLVDNELQIAHSVYGGRLISPVGLKTEWLREHVTVLGATGSGKTTLVKRLIAELSMKTEVPWWIFDLKGSEYADLVNIGTQEVLVLRPGLDPLVTMSLIEPGVDSPHSTYVILRELIRERSTSSELSPAMEKLLRDAVLEVASSPDSGGSVQELIRAIERHTQDDRTVMITRDALLNRLEILSSEPLGSILRGGPDAIRVAELLTKRVVFDLRHVARTGGMEAARLLYNLVAKRIFEAALRRGITSELKHVVVLEEASNLIPESYARITAADVTTGESMVMLQRATGQGVIVVSTRPNISSNVLANTATKFIFRLPYDSETGAKFLSIDPEQERYLRTSKTGRAIASLPGIDAFEIAVIPFRREDYVTCDQIATTTTKGICIERDADTSDVSVEKTQDSSMLGESTVISDVADSTEHSHRIAITKAAGVAGCILTSHSSLANRLIAFLASRVGATQSEIDQYLSSLEQDLRGVKAADVIRELVASSRIERVAIPLVDGGFVYALPGLGLKAVKETIIDYLMTHINETDKIHREDIDDGCTKLLFGMHAVIVFADHLKMSSMEMAISRIRVCMARLSSEAEKLTVVVRGSIAASKLREIMDRSEEFDAVEVVSAFPSSLQKLIQEITQQLLGEREHIDDSVVPIKRPCLRPAAVLDGNREQVSTPIFESQARLWSELIQDFVDLTGGQVLWEDIHTFIETTASQSLKTRAPPLAVEEGRKTLTEMLADERLTVVRVSNGMRGITLNEGLWVLNTARLQSLKEEIIQNIQNELHRTCKFVSRNHDGYDICADNTSFVVFPTQHQLEMLRQMRETPACRVCGSTHVVCILSASEYWGDYHYDATRLTIRTLEEDLSALAI